MILRRLAEHYDRLVAEGCAELAPLGFSSQKISFCIVLNPDGSLNQFERIFELDGTAERAKSIIVPGQSKPPGQGINPCLLWDNAEYLLGFTQDPMRVDRANREFEASRSMCLGLQEPVSHPSFTAVCTFFKDWSPERAKQHPELADIVSNFGVFRIAGETQYVHQQVFLPLLTTDGATDTQVAMSLVSGEMEQIARLHEPKIKGVSGAQTSGALLELVA